MSGVPSPQHIIVRPFGNPLIPPNDPGAATLPIPVPSQVGVLVGAASFEDGFPAATMTDPEAGGIPPYGQDFNGMSYMVTAYCAFVQAGQTIKFNAAAAAAFVGYAVGAIVQSAVDPSQFYYNNLDGNTNDPDVLNTGWVPFTPLALPTVVQTPAALPAGVTNDLPITSRTGFLELSADPAGSTLTSLAGGADGQIVVISNVSANLLDLAALTGPTPANQFRMAISPLTLLQNDSATFRKSVSIGKWVKI